MISLENRKRNIPSQIRISRFNKTDGNSWLPPVRSWHAYFYWFMAFV